MCLVRRMEGRGVVLLFLEGRDNLNTANVIRLRSYYHYDLFTSRHFQGRPEHIRLLMISIVLKIFESQGTQGAFHRVHRENELQNVSTLGKND